MEERNFRSLFGHSCCCVKKNLVPQIYSKYWFEFNKDIFYHPCFPDNSGFYFENIPWLTWNGTKLADLGFADDLILLATLCSEIQNVTNNLVTTAEKFGLRINVDNTKIQKICRTETDYLEINDEIIDRVASFLYLRNLQKSNSHVVFDTWSPLGKGVGKFKKSQKIWKNYKSICNRQLDTF